MKRAFENSIWYIIGIGVSLLALLTLSRFIFPSVSILGQESQKLTLNAIKSINCKTNKIDLKEIAFNTLDTFLQSIGLYKYKTILLKGDPTIDNVYQNCLSNELPNAYCEAIRMKLRDYCYRNIIKYTFGSADTDTVYKAFGCMYILSNGDLAFAKKSIVCCTPRANEVLNKFYECGLIDFKLTQFYNICGDYKRVKLFYAGEIFNGQVTEVCYDYMLAQIENFEKEMNFYLE